MRNILETQIIRDTAKGDTTVLAEILSYLTDEMVFASLGDNEQELVTDLKEFIKTYGIKVGKDEDSATVELMMDDHDCIEFEDVEYYINDSLTVVSEREEVLYEYLILHNTL